MNSLLFLCCFLVLATEAFDAAGGVHQLLFAGKERMASRADFEADIAFVSGPCRKRISAGAVNAHFVVSGMNRCLHCF